MKLANFNLGDARSSKQMAALELRRDGKTTKE
jgi:hypothetical protein